MKGVKVFFMTVSILGAVVSPLAVATGPDWSTGQDAGGRVKSSS